MAPSLIPQYNARLQQRKTESNRAASKTPKNPSQATSKPSPSLSTAAATIQPVTTQQPLEGRSFYECPPYVSKKNQEYEYDSPVF